MRHALVLIGLVALFSVNAAAQSMASSPLLVALPFNGPFAAPSDSTAPISPAAASLNLVPPVSSTPGTPMDALTGVPLPSLNLAPEPQVVLGVHQTYSWQAYVGYSYFRFYESSHPNIRESQNGVNWSIAYYWKDWLGFEGEMAATKGTQFGQNSWFLFGGGGPRFRWSGPRGLELWGHVLVGGSHFTPQTSLGKQEAFAYEAGGGVDAHSPWPRLGFRVGADMVGSHYFSTYQYSPKIFAGVVFKF